NRFTNDLDRVSEKATGMAPVMRELIRVIGNDGKNAVLLTILVVFLLLWLDFRKIKYAILAMIPLMVGFIWMVGSMKLIGMQLTIVNVMGLPMIIGIGIDYGVHVVHRWRIEETEKVNKIFASTGKAILLSAITTMLAFGSLIFSIWRGFGSLGGAMFIGVGACFLSTVIILSGLMGLTERKN
ncbi:MAG: MMPL family transporter, partial [Candidatus Caldatribacteriota bacterium]|nr:MMPL family transporter [Candidatus Caldatribacteriota bacterium]